MAEGKYRNKSLEAIFRETIETRIVPALQASPLCPKGRGQELTLCEGLVRVYDDDIRRVHPAHYDADALVTAVFELDGGGGGGYDGQGFYVQPGAHVSTRLPMSMRPGDLIAHGFDLQHGVEVRRCDANLCVRADAEALQLRVRERLGLAREAVRSLLSAPFHNKKNNAK